MTDPLPFTSDSSGWVREVVSLDIPVATGADFFEWTIQKPARIFRVRGVPVGATSEDGTSPVDLTLAERTELTDLWINRHPVPLKEPVNGKPRTGLHWEKGMMLLPRDVVRIHVRCPAGCHLVGELELAWLAN